jgi:predicted GNAT family N-acyltransferase
MTEHEVQIETVPWSRTGADLSRVRHQVFVIEQGVPVELEIDGLDTQSTHVRACSPEGEVIGTARLLPDGHIGRVAVLKTWRGRGIGQRMMDALIDQARYKGYSQVMVNAQISALSFYERLGFRLAGDEFMDAGIPHRRMTLDLG